MFDDIARNLVPAKKVGFTPVWIDAVMRISVMILNLLKII